jgi:hypothetical protein
MIRSLAVSVIMLANDQQTFLLSVSKTYVWGAIRRKCAVEPVRYGLRSKASQLDTIRTFVPSIHTFRSERLPQTVYGILIQYTYHSPISTSHNGLIVDTR